MTVQGLKAALVASVITFGFAAVTSSAEAKASWACMKDGKKVAVKGKNAKAKEKACASKGGTWEDTAAPKKVEEAPAPAPEAAAPADAGGGGGGW